MAKKNSTEDLGKDVVCTRTFRPIPDSGRDGEVYYPGQVIGVEQHAQTALKGGYAAERARRYGENEQRPAPENAAEEEAPAKAVAGAAPQDGSKGAAPSTKRKAAK